MCGVELATAVLRSDGMWPQGYAKLLLQVKYSAES
jgi:hypothetical protein